MTLFVSLTNCRNRLAGFLAAAACLMPSVAAADWQEVEVRLARFAPEDGALLHNVVESLNTEPVEMALPRTNINHRLVRTPPAPPLAERRALALAADAARWQRFAEEHLQDGDVMFRLGLARTHLILNFSKITAIATASPYSHTGIFRWHNGVPEVVDITDSGYRVQSFPMWMQEVSEDTFAVRRLKPQYRDRIPVVLAFLEQQEQVRPEFDFVFAPDNGTYYCNELTEAAFQSAGVGLSEMLPPVRFPGIRQVKIWVWLIEHVGGIDLQTPMYVAGNDDYGMFASDKLEPVYASLDDGLPAFDGVLVALMPHN